MRTGERGKLLQRKGVQEEGVARARRGESLYKELPQTISVCNFLNVFQPCIALSYPSKRYLGLSLYYRTTFTTHLISLQLTSPHPTQFQLPHTPHPTLSTIPNTATKIPTFLTTITLFSSPTLALPVNVASSTEAAKREDASTDGRGGYNRRENANTDGRGGYNRRGIRREMPGVGVGK